MNDDAGRRAGHGAMRLVRAVGLGVAVLLPASAAAQDPSDPLALLSAELRHCATDRQCVLVDSMPCPCSSGGEQIAINRGYQEFWKGVFELWGRQRQRVVCPQSFNCYAERAVCVEGTCVARSGARPRG